MGCPGIGGVTAPGDVEMWLLGTWSVGMGVGVGVGDLGGLLQHQ